MPCYVFTFHAYGSWLPDRAEGYVVRHEGIRPPDSGLARTYRESMPEQEAVFEEPQQLTIIRAALDAAPYIEVRPHCVATESSHAHVLVSWSAERTWSHVRDSLKKRVTIELKEAYGRERWLVRGASRKRVTDREHFEHLVTTYLPSHSGWKWSEWKGLFR